MKATFTILGLFVATLVYGYPSGLKPSIPELTLPEQPVSTSQQDPLTLLRHLMQTTSQQLERQKELEQCVLRFQQSRKTYIADTQDREAAMRMVLDAHDVLTLVQEQHLTHLLPPAFMKEISFFATFAEKPHINSP